MVLIVRWFEVSTWLIKALRSRPQWSTNRALEKCVLFSVRLPSVGIRQAAVLNWGVSSGVISLYPRFK